MKKIFLSILFLVSIAFVFMANAKASHLQKVTNSDADVVEAQALEETIENTEEQKYILEEKSDLQDIVFFATNSEILNDNYDKNLAIKTKTGTYVGTLKNDVLSYKGIPYAKAPVGNLRFMKAESLDKDDRVYEAYYYGKSPIQLKSNYNKGSLYKMGEDCLNLNIWMPFMKAEKEVQIETDSQALLQEQSHEQIKKQEQELSEKQEQKQKQEEEEKEKEKTQMQKQIQIQDKQTNRKLPVIVFFHGGYYINGGTIDPVYNAQKLIEKNPNIIVVTVETRQGALGFINLQDEQLTNETKKISSNIYANEDSNEVFVSTKSNINKAVSISSYSTIFSKVLNKRFEGIKTDSSANIKRPETSNIGIFDAIKSLEWINENIENFGGDKNNITIIGEGSGGTTSAILPIMSEAKGLFQKAILLSPIINIESKETSKLLTQKFMQLTEVNTIADLINVSEEKIKEIYPKLIPYMNFLINDGTIPSNIYDEYAKGKAKDIELIILTSDDDMNHLLNVQKSLISKNVQKDSFMKTMDSIISDVYEWEVQEKSVLEEIKVNINEFIKLNHKEDDSTTVDIAQDLKEFYDNMIFKIPAINIAIEQSKYSKVYMANWKYPVNEARSVAFDFIDKIINRTNIKGSFIDKKANTSQQYISNANANIIEENVKAKKCQTKVIWNNWTMEEGAVLNIGKEIVEKKETLTENSAKNIKNLVKYNLIGPFAWKTYNKFLENAVVDSE